MTDRRVRDLKQRLLELATPYQARVEIDQTPGGHLRATFSRGAVKLPIIMAATPSDWRALKNNKALVRRALRTALPALPA
jgi:hypothetical protein